MTDKEKLIAIRTEVERLKDSCASPIVICDTLLSFIDSMQKEPVIQNIITEPIGVPTGAVEPSNIPDKKSLSSDEIGNYNHKAVMESLHPQLKEKAGWIEELEAKLDTLSKEEFQRLMQKYEEKCNFKEEPVSEFMNIESMIESYKQRLISQANGVKNSPLIDMCLASYKHGINETLDTLNLSNVQEPVSEELEEAAIEICSKVLKGETIIIDGYEYVVLSDAEECFKAGAKWQKGHLWKPADGDDLPEINREVIAILDNGKVVFAHRPPEYWDGKNIITGKVTRHYPKTYDKGGWNIPDTKYWLDVELPKEIEL